MTSPEDAADRLAEPPTPAGAAPPRLAAGIELIGEFADSGFKEAPNPPTTTDATNGHDGHAAANPDQRGSGGGDAADPAAAHVDDADSGGAVSQRKNPSDGLTWPSR